MTTKSTRRTTAPNGPKKDGTATSPRTGASGPKKRTPTDAISVLMADHAKVEKLFQEVERSADTARRQTLVERIVTELSKHASIEEQILYPAIRETIPDLAETVEHSLEEHQQVKEMLADLERLPLEGEAADPELGALIEDVREHVEEEETRIFPRLRNEMSEERLRQLGAALTAAKRVAPTHPHPEAPNEPPANVMLGPAVGMLDRAMDVAKVVALPPLRMTAGVVKTAAGIGYALARRVIRPLR